MLNYHRIMQNLDRVNLDLAGYCPPQPNYLQIRARINHLINHYMRLDHLTDRLADLPTQFTQPHTRHWEPIDWQAIHPDQIIGISPDRFVKLLASATEVELPIRGYSWESWQYFQILHPEMAEFMGGKRNPDGSVQCLGIWEKEERQHAPALGKIYQQLTGEKLIPKPNHVLGYQPTESPIAASQEHVMTRIATEWGAATIYLWLMAHSTGALQQAIAQPFQDEVNHLAKFWGFNRWLFDASYGQQVASSTRVLLAFTRHHQTDRTYGGDLIHTQRSTEELAHGIELTFTLMRIMVRFRHWNQELSASFLRHLFGEVPEFDVPDLPAEVAQLAAAEPLSH